MSHNLIIFPKTLEKLHIKDIGLKLDTLSLFLNLYNSLVLAILN